MEDFVDLNGEIIPCSSEFLDYLQENIPLLEVYLATLKYPFSKFLKMKIIVLSIILIK